MDELYSINKNIDRVRMEQYDQTTFMEGMKNMLAESMTKTEIIKSLSENITAVTNAYNIASSENKERTLNNKNTKHHTEQQPTVVNNEFYYPKRPAKNLQYENKTTSEQIELSPNSFKPLHHEESSETHFDIIEHPPNELINSIDNTNKTQKTPPSHNIVRKRPQVVTNKFPENQPVFSNKKIVPGNSSYKDAVKTETNKDVAPNK